jgi:isocitrate/isopropylmalate dehydrogenase
VSKTFRIAAISGDGIGQEVMPEGMRVMQTIEKVLVEGTRTPDMGATANTAAL